MAAASFWALAIDVLLKILSIAGMILLVFSVLIMLLTYRKAKKISPLSLLISILISLICLVVYTELLHVRIPPIIWAVAFVAGGLVGTGWALTNRLVHSQGLIKSQGNIWYLAVWVLVFVCNQLIILLTGRPMRVAMIMLLVSTGLVFGNGGSMLVRFYRLRSKVMVTHEGDHKV